MYCDAIWHTNLYIDLLPVAVDVAVDAAATGAGAGVPPGHVHA